MQTKYHQRLQSNLTVKQSHGKHSIDLGKQIVYRAAAYLVTQWSSLSHSVDFMLQSRRQNIIQLYY